MFYPNDCLRLQWYYRLNCLENTELLAECQKWFLFEKYFFKTKYHSYLGNGLHCTIYILRTQIHDHIYEVHMMNNSPLAEDIINYEYTLDAWTLYAFRSNTHTHTQNYLKWAFFRFWCSISICHAALPDISESCAINFWQSKFSGASAFLNIIDIHVRMRLDSNCAIVLGCICVICVRVLTWAGYFSFSTRVLSNSVIYWYWIHSNSLARIIEIIMLKIWVCVCVCIMLLPVSWSHAMATASAWTA